MPETARVLQGRENAGDWRVEWFDDDGGCEVAIFSRPNARDRAIRYADRQYGNFERDQPSPVYLAARVSMVVIGTERRSPWHACGP
jgi:hypothetical protein